VSLIIDVTDDSPALVTLAGELDAFSSRQLQHRLDEVIDAGQHDLLIDLAALDFIDSTALGVLIGARRQARLHGGDVRLQGVTAVAKRVFDVTGLSQVFSVE
jgi:anti-sigma B factor antagonist